MAALIAVPSFLSARANARALEALYPRAIAELTREEAAAGKPCAVRGVVTHVSALGEAWFAIAPEERVNESAITVFPSAGVSVPKIGSLVVAAGRTAWRNPPSASLLADRVDIIREAALPEARVVKQADFRKGLLANRRVSITGRVAEVYERDCDSPCSALSLAMEGYTACVLVPGKIDPEEFLGKEAKIAGFVKSLYGEDGTFLDPELETMGPGAITVLDDGRVPVILLVLAAMASAVLLFFVGVFFTLWIKGRRERLKLAVVAAERRRMAADLHDTIEQHLAGANLIAAGVLALDDTPRDVAEAMKSLSALLANAKAEVRSAVLDLRSEEDESKSLASAVKAAAGALEKTGVHAHFRLRGLPGEISPAALRDTVLIMREAVTNAVKHGHAKTVIFASDPLPGGGCSFKIFNDGESFDPGSALGPETGHYGMSGMRERALRHRMEISWGRRDGWTFVELAMEKRP